MGRVRPPPATPNTPPARTWLLTSGPGALSYHYLDHRIEHMVTTADILGRVHRPRPLQYIPTRFPHTYAFDMLREHPEIVPLAVIERVDAYTVLNDLEPIEVGRMSRGDASTVCRVWAEWEGQDRVELDTALAYAYIEVHDIDITEEENSG